MTSPLVPEIPSEPELVSSDHCFYSFVSSFEPLRGLGNEKVSQKLSSLVRLWEDTSGRPP